MKKIVLLIFCLYLLIPSKGFSQAYVPFPKDSVAWKLRTIEVYYNTTTFAYVYGDTAINGQIYTRYCHSEMDTFSFSNRSTESCYFFREENKRIYRGWSSGEVLLYDFNLNINDTASFYNIGYGIKVVVLLDIDSIQLLNGEWRRRYHYESYTPEELPSFSIVEGLGKINGGLFQLYSFSFTSDERLSSCIFTPDDLLYFDSKFTDGSDCYTLNSNNPFYLPILDFQNEDLSIYPNPVENTLYFSKEIKNTDIKIVTITSQIVMHKIDFEGSLMHMTDLNPGIYFIVFSGEVNGIQKIVKL